MKLAALAATIAAASAMVAPPKIEMDDMIEAALKRGGTEDVFFHLSKTSTDAAKAHKASLIEANGALPVKKLLRVAIHDHLVEFTEREQRPIMEAAEKAGLKATSFWITNTVFVRGAPVDFIRKVMANKRMDVRKVNGNKEYSVIENVEGATQEEKFQVVDNDTQRRRTQIAEYGIVLTEAERAQLVGFDGEGVTVGSVDTGARWTHEALIGSYRGGTEVRASRYFRRLAFATLRIRKEVTLTFCRACPGPRLQLVRPGFLRLPVGAHRRQRPRHARHRHHGRPGGLRRHRHGARRDVGRRRWLYAPLPFLQDCCLLPNYLAAKPLTF